MTTDGSSTHDAGAEVAREIVRRADAGQISGSDAAGMLEELAAALASRQSADTPGGAR